MMNYSLESDEVILCEDVVEYKNNFNLILTSKKIIIEKDKEIVDNINLEDIKIYNDKVHQNGCEVELQTVNKKITIVFSNMIKANKFTRLIIDTVTNTTMTKRGVKKINGAIDTVDDVLGIDTRGAIKNVVEGGTSGGLVGSILGKVTKNKK